MSPYLPVIHAWHLDLNNLVEALAFEGLAIADNCFEQVASI